jgi:hypothetical protein
VQAPALEDLGLFVLGPHPGRLRPAVPVCTCMITYHHNLAVHSCLCLRRSACPSPCCLLRGRQLSHRSCLPPCGAFLGRRCRRRFSWPGRLGPSLCRPAQASRPASCAPTASTAWTGRPSGNLLTAWRRPAGSCTCWASQASGAASFTKHQALAPRQCQL